MYRLEHYIANRSSAMFIVVDDVDEIYAIGETGACAYNPRDAYTVTTHATAREIKNLSDILLSRGYKKYDAKSIDDMQEFLRAIAQKN